MRPAPHRDCVSPLHPLSRNWSPRVCQELPLERLELLVLLLLLRFRFFFFFLLLPEAAAAEGRSCLYLQAFPNLQDPVSAKKRHTPLGELGEGDRPRDPPFEPLLPPLFSEWAYEQFAPLEHRPLLRHS